MEKDNATKNLSVFSEVISSIVADAVAEVEGVCLVRPDGKLKKIFFGNGVDVSFLPNDKVTIEISVNINFGSPVPAKIAEVQDKIKTEVENATKYRVHSINVLVDSVNFAN
ncbi:MAG: Asp23/Gls24 family envelope stress response protein [Clostridia bacterium]|nr:Asp23/Gls24 family envelope stress response protein [Clostridia bacterium]